MNRSAPTCLLLLLSCFPLALAGCSSAPIAKAPKVQAPSGREQVASKPASLEDSGTTILFCERQWAVDALSVECHRKIETLEPLSRFEQLEQLDLAAARGAEDDVLDLSPLVAMDALQASLKALVLEDVTINDLTPIARLTALTSLTLAQVYRSDNETLDLSPLSSLVNLTHFEAGETYVPTLAVFLPLKKLRVLDLRNSLTPGSEFPQLSKLTQLVEIYLGDAPHENETVPIANLRFVRALPNLELLDLSCRFFDGAVAAELARAKKLKSLSLCHVDDFAPFSKLTGLSELRVLNAPGNLSSLAGVTSLRKLYLSGGRSPPIDTSFLNRLAKLEELSLRYDGFKDLSSLAKLSNLRKLLLAKLDEQDSLQALSALSELEELDVPYGRIGSLAALEGNKSLRKLGYRNSVVPPHQLARLRELHPSLEFDPPLASDQDLDALMDESAGPSEK